jgi:uncharacterized metal-binding protein
MSQDKKKPAPTKSPSADKSCSDCKVRRCYRQDKSAPAFCLTEAEANAEGVAATRALYAGSSRDAKLARAAAEVEGEYYGRLTRLEETIVFARKIGAKKLGIASCLGLLDEASQYADIVRTAGLDARTVICKVGSIDKTEIGLPEEKKVCPGVHEACCNPILQAKVLNDWGADLNVMVGLCVGHDALFNKHSRAPVVTFIVKDRVLGHNPAAALYTSKFYYKRVLSAATFPKPRLEKEKE